MRTATRWWGPFALCAWMIGPALGQAQPPESGAVYRVKDIGATLGSDPGSAVEFPFAVGDVVYFNASRRTTGAELWRSDGTAEGTVLVRDIFPGPGSSDPEPFASLGGTVFFSADDGATGRELWKSDGTAAGTVPVKDVRPGSTGSQPWMLTSANGLVFFLADDGVHGRELWKSDGTEAGTVLVKDIRPGTVGGPTRLYPGPGGVFLIANDGVHGVELWKSDGTEAGTVLVRDIRVGSAGITFSTDPRPAASAGSLFFFVANNGSSGMELWRSDGTEAGTLLVKDISANPSATGPANLRTASGRVVFKYGDAGSFQLFASDGTEAGTVLLPVANPEIVGTAGPYAYVQAADGTNGAELWRTDGTVAGTVLVKDIWAGTASSYPNSGADLGATLFFLATTDGGSWTLWKTDGTEAGTQAVRPLNGFQQPAGASTWLFFASSDQYGGEPWRSDGTEAGTWRLKNVATASSDPNIQESTALGGLLLFRATDAASGTELWKSDGTEAGTTSLDIQPGTDSSWAYDLEAAGDRVFFRAYDPAFNDELWASDGTPGGAALVKDIAPGPDETSDLRYTRALGDTCLFVASDGKSGAGLELWRSDGTEAGTVMLGDQRPGPEGVDPRGIVAANGTAFFMGFQDGYGRELWKTDGTEAGTVMVADVAAGDSSLAVYWMEALGGLIFFDAAAGAEGRELWRSDGTAEGTVMVRDVNLGAGDSAPSWLTAVGGTLFFAANDGTSGAELWKTDGTEAGTVLVKDIYPGAGGSAPVREARLDWDASQEAPAAYAALGSVLLFAANDGAHGLELWRSDGTAEGTVMVRDVSPGAAGSNPAHLTVHQGVLYFTASDGETGYELWRSDGTEEGTTLVGDVAPGSDSSSPLWLASTDGRLFFVADDGTSGYELWAVKTPGDLSIAKTDGQDTVTSGSSVTYTITVTNSGTSPVFGARVSDVLPAALQGATWTCLPGTPDPVLASCGASGSGDIDDVVALGPGESVVYSLEATVSGSGSVANTATVSAPHVADTDPTNDSATDTDTIAVPPTTSGLLIGNAEVLEGASGTVTASLTVTLTPAAAGTVTVEWATANGTASSGSDYVAGSGTLTFAAGETTKTVALSVVGDTQIEGDETFVVNLSNASGAGIWESQGQVTILNDDSASHALPFGVVDTPSDGATGVEGAIAVTGWSLDDTGVLRVAIYRDRVPSDAGGAGLVYIGDGVFVDGARPDVAAAYPSYPNKSRAGWGFQLLTNMLPNQGNGTYKLWVYSHDREGQSALLATRTITCSNATASLPFGTLDTPGQGATVSGTTVVFGWALTPLPGAIPTDGSTIWVFVDGVPLGHPVYDNYRSDIATLFPGYANSNGAVGYFLLDTTTLANGIHSIAWSVTDNLGRTQGIGSRFFWVSNFSGGDR